MAAPAALLKIKYKSGDEREFKLESDRAYYCFGRSSECHYRFSSGKISGIHFTIMAASATKSHAIVDGFPGRRSRGELVGKKSSTNSLLLNGAILTSSEDKKANPAAQGRAELKHGDKLVLPDGTEIEYCLLRPPHLLTNRPEEDTEAQYFGEPFTDVTFTGGKR